jgi:hypothetical protein
VKGEQAFCFWRDYWQMVVSVRAEICILAIQRNPDLLSQIREDMPYLLEHPGIQKELAEAFRQHRLTEPKRSRGRSYQITKAKFELYHWVYWYRHQGLSLEKACMETVDNHPELLPPDWTEPYEALKKQITRMDKYPRISVRPHFGDTNR